jgi:hypothetical protein
MQVNKHGPSALRWCRSLHTLIGYQQATRMHVRAAIHGSVHEPYAVFVPLMLFGYEVLYKFRIIAYPSSGSRNHSTIDDAASPIVGSEI